ncbi:MAG: histidine kinase [Candidatus Nanopelagicales bacterium]
MTVRREVVRSALLSLVAIVLITAAGFWAARAAATSEALRQAEASTVLVASSVIAPELDEALLRGDPDAVRRVDETVRAHVLGDQILAVKIWTTDGRILYSDDLASIGDTFPLSEEQREVLETGQPHAEVSDLVKQENLAQAGFGRLLEVYVPVETPDGGRLLVETYQSTDEVDAAAARILRALAPVVVLGLLVFAAIQLLLSWRLARTLEAAQRDRERLLQQTLDASERERASIAADLHDGVVQDLVGLTFALDGLAADSEGETAQSLRGAASTTRASVRSLRSLLVEIYPPNLDEAGLEGALTDLATAGGWAGTEVRVEVDPEVSLSPANQAAAYRAVREALSNAKKHSEASHVTVSVVPTSPAVRGAAVVTVSDDGVGYAPGASQAGHVGLRLLDDVAASVGAHLHVASVPGEGTTVRLELVP